MAKSTIEWTQQTWNPLTGCNKISPGCKNCYAARMAKRLKAMGNKRYRNEFELTLHEDKLVDPLKISQPTTFFVNSMADQFHEKVPESFILRAFETMRTAHQHTFQVLTKRADRLAELSPSIQWPSNVWMGVSVESADYQWRIDRLRSTGAEVKFLSLEPLLGPLPTLDLNGIHWVIVGGESGPGARPMDPAWVREIRDQCLAANVAFFFKQWGGVQKKKAGRMLDGRAWDEFPAQGDANEGN